MSKMSAGKEKAFAELVKEAKACIQCSRMSGSVRVVGPASGSTDAPIMIIGEAPGRLGADASAIPFHGDKAGDNFEALLEQVGLSRHDCFITNAALCNPKDENGNNATPSKTELQNCSGFLKRQIDVVNPLIVVTLGAQALAAIRSIEDHDLELSAAIRTVRRWYGRHLIALYHPGQRAMIHRSFFNQLTDYQYLAETFARLSRVPRPRPVKPTSAAIATIAERLMSDGDGISYFALHKLFYLAEYEFFRQTRRRMTDAYIVRQKEGPYVFEMHIKKLKKAIKDLECWTKGDRLMLRIVRRDDLFVAKVRTEFDDVIDRVINKYRSCSDSELKRVVYLTAPMRHLLKKEKCSGENTFNRPIDFSVIRAA
jgi:uracil-DNA glycosylase family 4